MKRQVLSLFIIASLILLSSGCGGHVTPAEEPGRENASGQGPDDTEDTEKPGQQEEPETPPAAREENVCIALVTDAGSIVDNGFNHAALEGIQTYADGAGVSYACYSADADTPDAHKAAVLTAIQDNAELIVCAGSPFEQAVGSLQEDYGNVYFLLLDGVPRDLGGDEIAIAPNVHCITYREEEAGYLVGYMAVLEGYRKLGFIGGEEIPSIQRYGYGYLQGIDDAAASLEASDDIRVEYWYGGSFCPDGQIEDVSMEWYQAGTEIIFACGGSLYQSVLASAETCEGMLIGADVDQSGISERFLTSAMKGISSSVVVALDDFFASGKKWPDGLAQKAVSYGAKEKCISLPVQNGAWRFQTATMDEYLKILARLRSGDIQIPVDTETLPETAATVVYHNEQEGSDS